MKKRIFAFILTVFIAFTFSSCSKEYVKNGEKRIVGTWLLVSSNTTTSYYSLDIDTYSKDCNSSTVEYTSTSTSEFDGETLKDHTVYENKETEDGETEIDKGDTTILYSYSHELTFNDDGTCKIRWTKKDKGTGETYSYEETGRWQWIDANKEKVGIKIEGDFNIDEFYIYIESLKKDEMVTHFTRSYASENNYTTTDWCWDDNTGNYIEVTVNVQNKETYSGSGSQTFTKKDE